MIRAKKHLDYCDDTECKFCSNNVCCYGLRHNTCYMDYNLDLSDVTGLIDVKKLDDKMNLMLKNKSGVFKKVVCNNCGTEFNEVFIKSNMCPIYTCCGELIEDE